MPSETFLSQPPPRPSPAAPLPLLPTLLEHRKTALPACLHRERRRSQLPDSRRTLRQRSGRERQRRRHHVKTPKPRGIRACRSCRCQRHRRAQRKFRRLTHIQRTRNGAFFAYLLKPLLICSSCVLLSTFSLTIYFFLPEVREFIKDTRPKTNTTRGGRKAHRPTPKTRTIHPPSSRTVSSGRVVGGRPQTPARLGVANPPGPISVSDPTRNTDGYPCRPSPQRRRAQGCHRTALRLAPAYAG